LGQCRKDCSCRARQHQQTAIAAPTVVVCRSAVTCLLIASIVAQKHAWKMCFMHNYSHLSAGDTMYALAMKNWLTGDRMHACMAGDGRASNIKCWVTTHLASPY